MILLSTQGSRKSGKANDTFKVSEETGVSGGGPGRLFLTYKSVILGGPSGQEDAGLDESKELPAEMLGSWQSPLIPASPGLLPQDHPLPPAEGSCANLTPTDAVKSSDTPSPGQEAVRATSTSWTLPNGTSSHSVTTLSSFPSLHDAVPRIVWVESKITHPPPLTY